MRVVDEARLEMPYAGARKLRVELRERTGGASSTSPGTPSQGSWRR